MHILSLPCHKTSLDGFLRRLQESLHALLQTMAIIFWVNTGGKPQAGTSHGTSIGKTTATGASTTPNYGTAGNQADPTGPAGGTLVGNQMTPGSSGGQSFGSAGYGQAVSHHPADIVLAASCLLMLWQRYTKPCSRAGMLTRAKKWFQHCRHMKKTFKRVSVAQDIVHRLRNLMHVIAQSNMTDAILKLPGCPF